MTHDDWVATTGSWLAGRGGYRPINPRLLTQMVTKAPRSAKSGKSGREMRKLVLRVAQLTGAVDAMLSPAVRQHRRTVRDASISEQSQPGPAGAAARLRHTVAAQHARKRF